MSEMDIASTRTYPLLLRVLLARPRLLLSVFVGLCAFAALTILAGELHVLTRSLLAWDVGVALFLSIAFRLFARSEPAKIRDRARIEDVGSIAILLLTVGASAVSVGALFAWLELSSPEEVRALDGLLFLYATVLLSWTLIHTIFALHYAHEYYGDGKGSGGGLIFPGDSEPLYFDFVYFAFTIGTSTAVSDVSISEKRIRHTVILHGITAFFFNVTVLALTVGLIGNAIQS
jgi:uncharacterized membrane protein